MVMRYFLLMIAVVMVGCGESKKDAEARAAAEAKEQSAIIEKAIRELFEMAKLSLENPEGELTEADLEKVTDLMLRGSKITDEGLKEVAKLPKLKRLYLHDTQITDAGFKELTQVKTLTWVGVNDTAVTTAGVADFQKALPKCKITHGGVDDAGGAIH